MAKFSFCQMTQSITAYWHRYFNSREFYNCVARSVCVCVCVCVCAHARACLVAQTRQILCDHQALLSMGFSKQEYQSG